MTQPPTNGARDETPEADRASTGQPGHSPEDWHGPGPRRPSSPASGQYPSGQSGGNQQHPNRPSPGQASGHAPDPSAFRPAAGPASGTPGSSYHPAAYAGQTHAQYGQPPGSAYARPQAYRAPESAYPFSPPPGTSAYPGAPQPGSSRDRRRGRGARATVVILSLLLPIGIAAGAFAGYNYANEFGSYDTLAVEREVVAVLRDDYGLSDISEVECPDWIKVEQGESFQCEFEYAGASQTVTVTQGSQSGQLVVGAPD